MQIQRIFCLLSLESSRPRGSTQEVLPMVDGDPPGEQGRGTEGEGGRQHGRYQSVHEGRHARSSCAGHNWKFCTRFYILYFIDTPKIYISRIDPVYIYLFSSLLFLLENNQLCKI